MTTFSRVLLFAVCVICAAEHKALHISPILMGVLVAAAVIAFVVVVGEGSE